MKRLFEAKITCFAYKSLPESEIKIYLLECILRALSGLFAETLVFD